MAVAQNGRLGLAGGPLVNSSTATSSGWTERVGRFDRLGDAPPASSALVITWVAPHGIEALDLVVVGDHRARPVIRAKMPLSWSSGAR